MDLAELPEAAALADYFESLGRGFEAAARSAGGVIDRFYLVAGRQLRLRFAGPALLASLTRALGHLETSAGPDPAGSILIWDGRSTARAIPPAPFPAQFEITRGPVRAFRTDRAVSLARPDAGFGLFAVAAPTALEFNDRCAPLRRILHWLNSGPTLRLVHGGAVGSAAGGVLLVGSGGSGKSTAALVCLEAGWGYGGDDYVLLGSHPRPFAHSLFSTATLEPDHVRRLTWLRSSVDNRRDLASEKALIFLHERYPDRMSPGFPIRAIVLPRVEARREPLLEPISSAAGLRALAPSTLAQVHGYGADAFHFLAEVARAVPSYALRMGQDLAGLPRLIGGLLENDPPAAGPAGRESIGLAEWSRR